MSAIEPEAKECRDAGEDEHDDASDDDVLSETTALHPLLRDDIERLREQEVYPEQLISYKIMPGTSEMLLTMRIPTTALSRSEVDAWKLIAGEPVIVRITLDPSVYLDAERCLEIDVLQPSAKYRGRGVLQLKNIATSFCKSSFCSLSNEVVASAVTEQTIQREADTLSKLSFSKTRPVKRRHSNTNDDPPTKSETLGAPQASAICEQLSAESPSDNQTRHSYTNDDSPTESETLGAPQASASCEQPSAESHQARHSNTNDNSPTESLTLEAPHASASCEKPSAKSPSDNQTDSQTPAAESLTCHKVSECETQSVPQATGGCDEPCADFLHDEQMDSQTPDAEFLTCQEVSECETQSVPEAAGGCDEPYADFLQDEQMSFEDSRVQHLVSMGFHECDAKIALEASGGCIMTAAEIILENQKHCQEAETKSLEGIEFGVSELRIASQISTDCGETMVDMMSENNAATFDLLSGTEKDQNENHRPCKVQESLPSIENGFLVQLFEYLCQRLPTLNRHCRVCDAALDPPHSAKLFTCANKLCMFHYKSYIMLGEDRKVTDLLLKLTKWAVMSVRSTQILSPFPALTYPTDALNNKLRRESKIYLLKRIMLEMPPVEELIDEEKKYVQERLSSFHPLCYPLVEWIIESSKAYISAVPKGKQLDFMGTRHQFLLRSDDRDFIEKKKAHGSVFAFHGSPIENWHSIIREGLVVATGTARQLHGAVYGNAIYLSTSLSASLHFSVGGKVYRHLLKRGANTSCLEDKEEAEEKLITGQFWCIALCEVIDQNLAKGKKTYACRQSMNVCIRMLFVYDALNPPNQADQSADTTDFSVNEKIVKTL